MILNLFLLVCLMGPTIHSNNVDATTTTIIVLTVLIVLINITLIILIL
jgi:hypothetical protein